MEPRATVFDAFSTRAANWPGRPCLGRPVTGKRHEFETYAGVLTRVERVASGLHKLGIRAGDCIALYGMNSVEYAISILAAFSLRAAAVPLYDTLGKDTISHCIEDAQTEIAFCSRAKLPSLAAAAETGPAAKRLKTIILLESEDEEEDPMPDVSLRDGLRVLRIRSLEEMAAVGVVQAEKPTLDDLVRHVITR
eukprot:tig00020563_g11376.t1